ncbi:MAG: tetratricopeptide repeat protein [Candidatus Omnitrophota bacterium]
MRFFLILVISSLIVPLSFAQSQRSLTNLYSNYLKGLLYAQEGEYLQGLEELERAKAADPQSIHIRLKIASVLILMGRLNEAETVLKEAKQIDPDNLDIHLALIFVYSYSEKNQELEEEYESFLKQAHKEKPKDIGISAYLAQFYFHKKRPQEAIKIYEKILETNPDYVEAFFWLGFLYDERGQREKALETWEKGRVLDSSFTPILNCLGYTYAEEGINLDLAEELVKKALEKEPENGAYLDSLGWVYFKKGEIEKAKEHILKAIGLVKDPDIYEHLGDIYIEIGDREKGVSYYREGLQQFPDDKDLKVKVNENEHEE